MHADTTRPPILTARKWQFGLRSLVIGFVVITVPLAWWANVAHRQRKTLDWLAQAQMRYEASHFFFYEGGKETSFDHRRWTDDLIHTVEGLQVVGVGEEALQQIARLSDLKHLVMIVGRAPLDDEDSFAVLKRLESLRLLQIVFHREEWKLRARDFEHICDLLSLEELYILGPMESSSFARISKLQDLHSLQFDEVNLENSDVACLAELPHLESLTIGGHVFGSDELPSLQRLLERNPRMQFLSVNVSAPHELVENFKFQWPDCEFRISNVYFDENFKTRDAELETETPTDPPIPQDDPFGDGAILEHTSQTTPPPDDPFATEPDEIVPDDPFAGESDASP